MRLLKKRKQALSAGQEQAAGRIADTILKRQRQIADYLNARTAHLSGISRLLILILFCAIVGSYFIYRLLQAFH